MKQIPSLFFIILIAISSRAQELSIVTVGVAYPASFKENDFNDAHYSYSFNNANYKLLLEKDFEFEAEHKFRITPGIDFTRIRESFKNDGLGGGGKGNFKHKALSGYIKLVAEIDRQAKFETDFYLGVQLGYYLYTNTSGTQSLWQMNPDGDNYYAFENVNKSGKDFFHFNYIGIVVGVEPPASKVSIIQPKFEITYYPGFVTQSSYYFDSKLKKNIFQFSLSFKIAHSTKEIQKSKS